MNIHQFFQVSVNALQDYILLHYDRATWFSSWVGLSDVRKYFQTCGGSVGSPYFHFDWTSAGYRRMAENWTLYRCKVCNTITASDYCCEVMSAVPLSVDEAFEYFRDHRYDIYEQELLDALLYDCWRVFCSELHPIIHEHRQEILGCLTAIAGDQDPMDQLVHLMWALKIPHHKTDSNVVMDYSLDDTLPAWVDRVRTEGIKDVFGEEDVNKFLASEYPPIHIDLEKIQKDCPPFGDGEWEARYGEEARKTKNQSITYPVRRAT